MNRCGVFLGNFEPPDYEVKKVYGFGFSSYAE